MKVATTSTIKGNEIKETLGLVKGNTVKARWLGKDIGAIVRHVFGGEIKTYTSMISDARDEALKRMKEEAKEKRADAIVSIRFTTARAMGGAAEILAYGTAVKLENPQKSS